jgi:hypothetical protein
MIPDKTKSLIFSHFEVEIDQESVDDEALFQILTDQIAYLIQHRFEFLMSLMYRLDIEEMKIHQALAPDSPEPANVAIARLVIERQVKRMETKEKYKQDPLPDWD